MTNLKLVKVPAIMTRISPTKDGGFSMGFHTNEVTDDKERANMLSMYNTFGWLLFASESIYEVPLERPDRMAGQKSQSERIRAVLFLLWEAKYKDKEDREAFYNRMTEAFINKIKEELPER